jgi:uncharacterized OsmC-like protein
VRRQGRHRLEQPAVAARRQARQALEQAPEERGVGVAGLGACRFRASNTWLSGNHNRSTVTGFHGARQEIAHRQSFTLDADEPAILAGNDEGANPVEHLLHALASCLTTSMVAHAAVRGIEIEELAKFSPVFNTLTRGARVVVEVNRK